MLIAASITFGLLLVLGAVYVNFVRARKRINTVLRPNCLITRSPLVFVSGRRHLFNFAAYWGHVPQVLRDHGYEVFELNIAWRDSAKRQSDLAAFVAEAERHQQTYHFVFDRTGAMDAEWLTQRQSLAVKSVSIPGLRPGQRPGDQDFLDLAVSLAEKEYVLAHT